MPEENKAAMHGIRKRGGKASGENVERLGLVLMELGAEQINEMQLKGGLLVEEIKTAAARAGLHAGDVILAIGNDEVRTLQQCNEILKSVQKGRNVALLVRRGDNTFYVPLKLDEK
jgi:serine protease Do